MKTLFYQYLCNRTKI